MKDFRLPKLAVAITMLVGLTAAGCEVALKWFVENPPVFKNSGRGGAPHGPESALALVPLAVEVAPAPGYLVLKLHAAAELDSPQERPVFEGSIESLGFATGCDNGKVVPLNLRAHDQGGSSSEDGAVGLVDTVVCLPAQQSASVQTGVDATLTPLEPQMDEAQRGSFGHPVSAGAGHATVVDTGRGLYEVFVGGVTLVSCSDQCADKGTWGAAALVSVAKVSRALESENYLFSVPVEGGNAQVSLSVPVVR